jgi:hypothetical protein
MKCRNGGLGLGLKLRGSSDISSRAMHLQFVDMLA